MPVPVVMCESLFGGRGAFKADLLNEFALSIISYNEMHHQ